jgi:hypothetical protein
MWRDGVRNKAERRRARRKIWKGGFWVWSPCNTLKFHKTTKAFFGKAWRKTCEIWKSLEKSLEPAIISPSRLSPQAPRGRARWRRPRAAPTFELAQVVNRKVAKKGAQCFEIVRCKTEISTGVPPSDRKSRGCRARGWARRSGGCDSVVYRRRPSAIPPRRASAAASKPRERERLHSATPPAAPTSRGRTACSAVRTRA